MKDRLAACGTCTASAECLKRIIARQVSQCEEIELLDGTIIPQDPPPQRPRPMRKPIPGLANMLLGKLRQGPQTVGGLQEMYPQFPESAVASCIRHLRDKGIVKSRRVRLDGHSACEYSIVQ